MVVVICAVAVVGVMMLTMLSATVETSEWTDREVTSFQVEAAAETAVAMVASDLWTGFERERNGRGGVAGFQAYLESKGVANQTREQSLMAKNDYRERMSAHQDEHGRYIVDGIEIDELLVRREDAFGTTRLFIECNARQIKGGGNEQTEAFRVQHVYEIGAAEWQGTDFALLANNVNCLLCHTDVDSAERFYNEDPLARGTFDRVRLGSLETFHLREDPQSNMAGALYLGGDAVHEDGSRITDWHALSIKSADFDTGNGKLNETPWGGLNYNPLNPASALDPQPYENLYLDYLNGGPEAQVDGSLPDTFPSPFPDDGGIDLATGLPTPEFGGNRSVDKNEFAAATAGVDGVISGGTISVMPKNNSGKVTNGSQLNAMRNGNAATLAAQTDANVYLHGTKDNPLILDGPIAVDGDLIISGYVKGVGSLKVSGNVYIPTDLKYLDAPTLTGGRVFGQAVDGTTNTLAIASGGNVVIGDYYRPAWGNGKDTNGWGSGSFNFVMEEMATFNRMEWMKTQATLPGEPEYVMTGENVWTETKQVKVKETYEVEEAVYEWQKTGNKIRKTRYKWVTKNNGKPEPYYSEWSEKEFDSYYWVDEKEKVQTGTRTVTKTRWVPTGDTYEVEHRDEIWEWKTPQYANPYYLGEDYFARYYSFGKNTWVPIPNKEGYFDPEASVWMADELQGDWDSKKMRYARESDSSDPFLYNSDGTPKASVVTVDTESKWINWQMMTNLIKDAVKDRDKDSDLEIDSTIYTNNSIFGMVADDHRSKTNGRLLVNGLLVAADVGLLAPNGMQINYDPRGRPLVDIQSENDLTIRRHLRTPLPAQ